MIFIIYRYDVFLRQYLTKTTKPMAEFIAFDTTAEVNGQTILSVLDGMPGFETTARKILKDHGIDAPTPDSWYPQQSWLDAFKHIALKVGDAVLTNIGKKIPENAEWPPHVNSIVTALESIDIAYHMNHKAKGKILFDPATGAVGDGIGSYKYELLAENSVKMTCKNPYPCSFDRGILKAIAEKFKPLGYKLAFKENVAKSCRKQGDHYCTYLITWNKISRSDLKPF